MYKEHKRHEARIHEIFQNFPFECHVNIELHDVSFSRTNSIARERAWHQLVTEKSDYPADGDQLNENHSPKNAILTPFRGLCLPDHHRAVPTVKTSTA